MEKKKVNRDELNKVLRQRLQVNNVKKEIFPLVEQRKRPRLGN